MLRLTMTHIIFKIGGLTTQFKIIDKILGEK